MQTILIVDDKASLRGLVRDYLEAEGFRVLCAANGREGLFAARRERPDLVLLDIMMPEMNGYEFIRAFRKESEAPIILLTARLEEEDKVLGLEMGADDYVTKPFGMKELTARIHAVLRRAARPASERQVLSVGSLRIEQDTRQVSVDGVPAALTPSEFDLLLTLMSAPGRVFSRSELLTRLQGTSFEGVERTIDVHIRNLRTKIEKDPSDPEHIETVFGVGYRFHNGGRGR